MSDVKYTPPAFPVPLPAHAYVVPPLVDGGGSGGGAPGTHAATALEFCVFTVDVRVGWPRSYPLHGLCDDATLASVDGLAVRAERKRAKPRPADDNTGNGADDSDTPNTSDDDTGAHAAGGGFVLPDPRLPAFAYLTGHTATGAKVGVAVPWRPACQVEVCKADAREDDRDRAKAALVDCIRDLEGQLQRVYGGRTANAAWRTHLAVEWHVACRFNGYVPTAGKPLERQQYDYAEVSAANPAVLKWVAGTLRRGSFARGRIPARAPYAVHEDGIDAEQAFVDAHGIQPCGWVSVPAGALTPVPEDAREMAVHYEFALAAAPRRPSWYFPATRWRPFTRLDGVTTVPSMVVACVDAEMTSGAAGRFPQAQRPEDAVVVVGVVLTYTGGSLPGRPAGAVFERHAFVWGEQLAASAAAAEGCVADIPGVTVHAGFASEGAMLAAVRDLLFVHRCVDIVAGHNIVKFDVAYLATRAARAAQTPPGDRFCRFGVLVRERLQLREKRLTSSAFGANNLQLLPGAGFAYVDTMLLCKVHPKKLRQNTLAAAAEAFLPPNDASAAKFDMPYEDIPGIAAGSDPVAWAALAGYCVQDCELVHKLLVAWDTARDLVAQSRTINIPLAANVLCGQQQRVRDSVMLKARASAMVMNGVNVRRASNHGGGAGGGGGGDDEDAEPVTATGGFVLDNVAGFHDAPVVVLDFASLYPSVQRSRNLCWSTVVDDATWAALSEADRRALGIETHDTPTGTFRFATNVEGVFPAQLGDLLAARTAAKRDMAAAGRAKDAASAAMAAARAAGDDAALTAATEAFNVAAAAYLNADARQKATKIVMNSGYGTANAAEGTGVMPCRPLGTTTCWVGAQLNRAAKAHVEAKFGAVVLYGDTDSIMVVFPRRGAAAAPDADRFTILQDAFDQAEEAEASLNALFAEAEAQHAAAKAAALGASGAAPVSAGGKVVQIVQTEAEKIYYPWASLGKKVYTGVKYEHRPKPDAPRDLAGTGSIEAKGMKMVRRDVPLFTRRLTQALLDAMLVKRDNAAFWTVVHDFVYRVCLGPREHGGGPDALPLSEFTITRELKEGFETQKPLGPQAAVAYAAEWARAGSCPLVGDRVAYAFVTTPDPRRIRRPPWMPSVARCTVPKCEEVPVWALGPHKDVTRCMAHVPAAVGFQPVRPDPSRRCVECSAGGAEWVTAVSAKEGKLSQTAADAFCAAHVPKAAGWCRATVVEPPEAEVPGGSTTGVGVGGSGAAPRAAAGDVALRSAYARSAGEMEADPESNVLDVVYYVEKCVATVVEQLRPDAAAKASIQAAIAFAKRVAARATGLRAPTSAAASMWSARCGLEWASAASVDMAAVVAAVRAQQPLRVLPGSEVPVPGGGGGAGGPGTGAGAYVAVHVKTASEHRQAKAVKAAEAKRQAASLLRFLG